ncbi:rhomboid family intramembrane serine protease [Inquilinus sp. KBS0705]|nr:rhomboid family intramembrane serine protease [Inquilinus sp. KBS0705]
MAIGFTPKHTEDYSLDNLTVYEFLTIANESVKALEWELVYISNIGLIAYTNKSVFSRNFEVKIKIVDNIADVTSSSIGSEIIDFGKNRKNVATFISEFNELRSSLLPEEIAEKYLEISDRITAQDEDILKLPPPTTIESIKGFFSIFKPVIGYYITPLLININILVFALMIITGTNILLPDNESLLNWGANFRPITLEGQWWRLITSCFLHAGALHLVFNMYALLYIGLLLEPHLGKLRFLSAYLLTGIIASVTSLAWHDLTISVGASGAIFGMYGVFLALLSTNIIEKATRKALLTSIGVFVVFNLMNGLKEGIDNSAHIGGLLSGLIIGFVFIPGLKKPDSKEFKIWPIGALAISVSVLTFFVFKKLPNELGKYDTLIKQFTVNEEKALAILNQKGEGKTKQRVAYELKYEGVPIWNEEIKLVDEAEKLKIPDNFHKRDKKLRQYCEFRIKSYNLIYKVLDENTYKYQSQIDSCNREITAIIESLKSESHE